MINILVADDHSLYLEGLIMLLEKNKQYHVLAKANNGANAITMVASNPAAELLLLDLHLPDMNALEIVEQIRKLNTTIKIIILTHQKGNRYLPKFKQYNISAYVLKNIEVVELVNVINIVLSGGQFYSPDIFEVTKDEDFYLKSSVIHFDKKETPQLTTREIEIVKLICQEKSSSDIAAELFISIGTVDTHRKNILNKLGVTSTVGLVKYALRNKWLT